MPSIQISYDLVSQADLSAQEWALIRAAELATTTAYAPYSNFWVGTALLLENGEIVQGSNQENAAYPSGLCAERVAFFKAGSGFPNVRIVQMAVVAKRANENHFLPVASCGACRQVMLEYEYKQKAPIKVLFRATAEKYYRLPNVACLLPFQFTAESL